MQHIINFLFILSLIYNLVFIFDIIIKLRDNNPTPIKKTVTEQILLYFSISFFFYYIIF